MPSLRDFANLIVPEFIPMAITSALVGAVFTSGMIPDARFWLVSGTLFFIIAGFNSFNAIADKEIDAVNKMHRPLPKKTITEKQAFLFAAFSYLIALSLALLVNPIFFLVTIVSTILTIAYSYPQIDLKKRFLVGTLTVTIFYAILSPLSGWALYPSNPIPIDLITFLFIVGFGLSITKDFSDIPGDSYNQVQSLPISLGYKNALSIVFFTVTVGFGLLALNIFQQKLPQAFYGILLFYPIFLLNVYSFKYNSKNFDTNQAFIRTIALIILLELGLIWIKLT